MTPETSHRVREFFANFGVTGRPHLLLDYDGTLAAFRVDRFRSRPWSGISPLLQRIQRNSSTRLAIITGRPAAEIAPMLRLDPPLEVWGLHGAERLSVDGRRQFEATPAAASAKLEELRLALRLDPLGGLFEEKANAAVIHWRGFSRRQAAEIERRARQLFEPLAHIEGLTLLQFESGVELRAGRDKGGAVEAILAETGDGGPVAYLGDDLSDEAAFRAVQRQGTKGLGVLVRRQWRATGAEIWLTPPAELKSFLKQWADACEESYFR